VLSDGLQLYASVVMFQAPDALIGYARTSIGPALQEGRQDVRLPITSWPSAKQEGFVELSMRYSDETPKDLTHCHRKLLRLGVHRVYTCMTGFFLMTNFLT
jgi:hypothetical protein